MTSWLIALALGVVSMYGLRVAWREWRGVDGADPEAAPDWWPFDLPSWRALIRAGPVGGLEAGLIGARYLVSLLDDSAAVDLAGTALESLAIGAVVLMVVVGLFNRPGWAVAPRLRGFPGALDEWRAARPPG